MYLSVLILKDAFCHWVTNLKIVLDKVPAAEYISTVNSIISESFPDISLRFIKLKKTGKKFWIGLNLDFPDADNIENMQQITDIIKERLSERLAWAGEIDFFLGE